MPEPQLQQKVQNLEKIEQYLKQQVSDLEDDRQGLYDLLREDKKLIHDLRIKVRTLELSEENIKNRYDRIFDSESKLSEENDNLKDKIHELELLLSIQTKKAGTDKSQVTDPYESEQLQNLNSQIIQKDNEIKELINKNKLLEKEISDRYDDVKGKDGELRSMKNEVEALNAKLETRSGTARQTQTDEGTNKGRHAEVQSDESFFHKKAEKVAFSQTEDSAFDDKVLVTMETQTDDVEVGEKKIKRNKDVQVDAVGKSVLSEGVQTEDDYNLRENFEVVNKRLMQAEDEIKKKDENLNELQRITDEKEKELSRRDKENKEHLERMEKLTREGGMLKDMFDRFKETSNAEKLRQEEEIKKLKEQLTNKDIDLNNTTLEKEKALDKLRTIQMDLVSAETSRDEKAGILLNKLMEIAQLKKNIDDKDQEAGTLWADMNKIQANYTNYIETSETERALLENRLKDLMREVKIKGEDLEMAKKENERLSEKLKKKDEDVMALTNDKNELTSEFNRMKRTLKDKEDELKLLLEELNNLKAKNASLIKDHEKCPSTQDELERNLERLKGDLKLLRDKNMDLTNEIEAKDSKIELLTSKNSDQEDRIKSFEDEHLQFKEKLNKTELSNKLLNSTNEEKMRIITNTILKHQAEKKSEEMSTASQISFLKNSLKNKDEEIKLLTNDVNNLHKKYLDVLQKSSKIPEESQENVDNVSRLNAVLTRKDDEIKTLMSNEESLQKSIIDLMGTVQNTKDTSDKERTRLERELKDKTMNLEDKNKKLNEAMREIQDSKLKLNEHENKMADLKDKLIQVTNALKASSQHNKELLIHQKNASRLAQEKDELEKHIDELNKKHFNENTKLKDKLDTTLKEKNGVEKSLQDSKLQLTKLENEVAQTNLLQTKINQLVASNKEKDRQLINMSEKVNSMRNDINNLLNDKRNYIQKESYYNNLQKEFDQLSAACQKQAQDLRNSRIKERDMSVQLKQKDLLIKGLNSELSECMELSRKLNILNISR